MEIIEAMAAWCTEADQIAMGYFLTDLQPETKADGSPVTVADKAIEDLLRSRIHSHDPRAAIVGEEQGGELPGSGVAWILDPIDGTKNYARGVPVFATLLARWEDGNLTHAMVSAPALGNRWWAVEGRAFRDGSPIKVSRIADLADADLCTGGLQSAWVPAEARPGLDRTLAAAKRHRGFGDFWGHMLVAQGSMDAMVDYAPLALYDIAAPRCIVEAAGGRVSSLEGDLALAPGPAVSSNGSIHQELLASLASNA